MKQKYIKSVNPVAIALKGAQFKKRIVKSKKTYDRKRDKVRPNAAGE